MSLLCVLRRGGVDSCQRASEIIVSSRSLRKPLLNEWRWGKVNEVDENPAVHPARSCTCSNISPIRFTFLALILTVTIKIYDVVLS